MTQLYSTYRHDVAFPRRLIIDLHGTYRLYYTGVGVGVSIELTRLRRVQCYDSLRQVRRKKLQEMMMKRRRHDPATGTIITTYTISRKHTHTQPKRKKCYKTFISFYSLVQHLQYLGFSSFSSQSCLLLIFLIIISSQSSHLLSYSRPQV